MFSWWNKHFVWAIGFKGEQYFNESTHWLIKLKLSYYIVDKIFGRFNFKICFIQPKMLSLNTIWLYWTNISVESIKLWLIFFLSGIVDQWSMIFGITRNFFILTIHVYNYIFIVWFIQFLHTLSQINNFLVQY